MILALVAAFWYLAMIRKGAIWIASSIMTISGCTAAYTYFRQKIDKSSLLVRQVMMSIRSDPSFEAENHFEITSPIGGAMNQRKGFADVNFDITNKEGIVTYLRH